jgi:hypothetical protein
MINWDKIAKLSTWFVIVALTGIIVIAILNLLFPEQITQN